MSPDSPKRNTHSSRKVTEFASASALPDFVQDHLVIEQCYLGKSCVNRM